MTNPALDQWALDREIVLSRVVDAPKDLIFAAWTDPKHIVEWYGPEGFTLEVREVDIRVGGRFRFVYVGPDGTRWENRMVYRKIEPGRLIEFDHGTDEDDYPGLFRCTITFDEQSDGKTVVTLRQLHPTAEQRTGGIGFGAVAIGYTTLDKLEAYVAKMRG